MVHLAYLGKEYGVAKLLIVILGVSISVLGSYSFFNSAWVKREFYLVCDFLSENPSISAEISASCPSIILEKAFILITLFTFSLSLFLLFLNVVSKQAAEGYFRLGDILYHAGSGLAILVGASLFLVSALGIKSLLTEIEEKGFVKECPDLQRENASLTGEILHTEKVVAGSLAIVQGLIYIGTAALLFFR